MPLLFLHNGGASHKIWERQVAYFADRYECFSFDLPGYGASADPALRYPLQSYVDFLEAFTSAKKISNLTLIGNCIGSAISLSYAMRNPLSVDRLVLFNLLTNATVRDGELAYIFNATERLPALRPILRSLLGSLPVPAIAAKMCAMMQYGDGGDRDPELRSHLISLYHQKGQMKALAEILIDVDSFRKLDEFAVSPNFPNVLLIWGASNRILRCRGGRELASRLKPQRFEVIAGAGHLPMHESAGEVNHIIDEFLSASAAAR